MRYRRVTPSDTPALIRLAAENAPDNPEARARGDGFLTGHFDAAKFAAFDRDLGILVADDAGTVAGLLCANTTDAAARAPILRAMLDACADADWEGQKLTSRRLFFYGPVCIGRDWRGQGILKGLFAAQKRWLAPRFDVGTLFIDRDNPHSLAAHERGLGMSQIARFGFGDREYLVLAFACDA